MNSSSTNCRLSLFRLPFFFLPIHLHVFSLHRCFVISLSFVIFEFFIRTSSVSLPFPSSLLLSISLYVSLLFSLFLSFSSVNVPFASSGAAETECDFFLKKWFHKKSSMFAYRAPWALSADMAPKGTDDGGFSAFCAAMIVNHCYGRGYSV